MKDSLEMPDSACGGTGEVDGAAILNASVDSAVALEPVMELNNEVIELIAFFTPVILCSTAGVLFNFVWFVIFALSLFCLCFLSLSLLGLWWFRSGLAILGASSC